MNGKIKLNDTIQDIMFKMAEGNPGAMTVLMRIIQSDQSDLGLERILDLDSMGIYGSQIWVGYKDHCGSDINYFLKKIKDRDPILKLKR